MRSEAYRVSLLHLLSLTEISYSFQNFFHLPHIHNKYVRTKSVAEVNLDYDCREAIEADLPHATLNIFDEAKFVVLDLIKYDLYVKFVDSDIYRNFKGIALLNLIKTKEKRERKKMR